MKQKNQVHFYNKVMDITAMKELIQKLIDLLGMTCTSHILDQLKFLGFHQATEASFSLAIDDLLAVPSKGWLVKEEDQQAFYSEKQNILGNLHTVETLRQLMERWHTTSEFLKEEMHPKFHIIEPLNPVYMMSFSGARGNKSQVHQLLGMRGLMSDPQGKIVDLPIQGNFQEGLSLTEYIISSYGARKGVVDTAIRTADAGYITRRLVEVVQHIVVRKIDCGSTQGIFYSPHTKIGKINFLNKIMGRVLADHVYINKRCVATRNQEISAGLFKQFVSLSVQSISIRSPFTCKSLSWICQLCYGQSLSHNNLIELGEAVGIIAGQSIGEPGTQLTLRTFHTGGVFTGNIAGTIRAPFNGRIQFNPKLVYPIRTYYGHPAYICSKSLFLIIKDSGDKLDYSIIPTKSWIFVQNYQNVESEQLIAEIHTKISFLKEKVIKYIYSELNGEMHWSTLLWHEPKNVQGNVHCTLEAGHLWILSGTICKPRLAFPFPKDQDQVTIPLLITKQQNDFDSSVDNLLQNLSFYRSEEKFIQNKFFISIPKFLDNFDCNIKGKKQKNRILVPLLTVSKRQKKEHRLLFPNCILKISRNGLLNRNTSFYIWNNSQYKIVNSEFLECIYSSNKFFLLDHIFCRVDTQKIGNKKKQVFGLVQFHKKKPTIFAKILSINIYFYSYRKIKKSLHIFRRKQKNIFKELQLERNYFQKKRAYKKKSFVLLQTTLEYQKPKNSSKVRFCTDLFREENKLHIKENNFFHEIKNLKTNVHLIWNCLILIWENKSIKPREPRAYTCITSIRTKKIIIDMIELSLTPINQKHNLKNLVIFFHQAKLLSSSKKYTATFRSLSKEDKSLSWIILATSDYFQIKLLQTLDIINEFEEVSFLGHLYRIHKVFLNCKKRLFKSLYNYLKVFEAPKCYIMDENSKFWESPTKRITFFSNSKKNCEQKFPIKNLGQLLWQKFAISRNESFSESGQIIVIREKSLIVRLAKPYLATPKSTIHGNYAEMINQGNSLITYLYERFQSSDITRGLPKVEQFLEAHSKNPVVQSLENSFRKWNQDMTITLGSFWGLVISTKITLTQGQIHLVNQIQKVYQSQGVHICEKHLELIIQQMTSRVLVSKDVMLNVFLPGELVFFSRAQKLDRAFDEVIHYQTKILGITKSSFETTSFISEASFQETTRVLAKAAFQGRIDWLKGLKENLILSSKIPAGTGKWKKKNQKVSKSETKQKNLRFFFYSKKRIEN
uniref:DNA-directed RNA polymerase subunit beta'' n=1 Tax=Ephedra intermedia TaxID=173278 RepID=A0A5C0F3G7_9SPER|nr:RNA polymerase beta subunit [Ephedra intermedia]QEI59819.1 RNA polymerase beta subunit [Ephedra intermedia]